MLITKEARPHHWTRKAGWGYYWVSTEISRNSLLSAIEMTQFSLFTLYLHMQCLLACLSLSPSKLRAKVLRYTVGSRKYPPLFAHYFEAKVGRGCWLGYSICISPSHPFLCVRSTIMVFALAFWKNSSFTGHVLEKIRGISVHTMQGHRRRYLNGQAIMGKIVSARYCLLTLLQK